MSEFDLPSGGADYGFDDKDSFSLGSENVSATGPSGGSGGTDSQFFGDDSVNVMDFGRGPVSNISDTSSFDPNFAALQMIGRGLTPGFDLRNQITFDVPNQMLPQIEGRLGPLAPKYYSPVERVMQEDFADIVQSGPGIIGLVGKGLDMITSSFKDAKKALGKMGNASGGLSLSDLMSGVFSSETGQRAMDDMADNVSFDASGNRIDLGDTRQIADFQQPLGSIQSNLVRNAINQRAMNQRNFQTGYDDDPLIDLQPPRVEEVRPYGIFRDQLGRPQLGFRPTFQT